MFQNDRRRFGRGLKIALLSGAMGVALAACEGGMSGPETATVLPPTADMMTAVGPSQPGAPAPIEPGHPDRGTVGGGPGTGAWQSDEQTTATGQVGTLGAPEADDDDVTAAGVEVEGEDEPSIGAAGAAADGPADVDRRAAEAKADDGGSS